MSIVMSNYEAIFVGVVQGRANPGQTIYNSEGKKFALHLIPSGILNEETMWIVVQRCYDFKHCTRLPHWNTVKWILRYLASILDYILKLKSSSIFKYGGISIERLVSMMESQLLIHVYFLLIIWFPIFLRNKSHSQ